MSVFDVLSDAIKQQPGRHYRWVNESSEKLSRRKAQGFEFVSPLDPSVKGTILEKHIDEHSRIFVGGMYLMHTSKKRAEELQAQIDKQNKMRMDSIERSYREAGDQIKRSLGTKHKGFNVIVEKEND